MWKKRKKSNETFHKQCFYQNWRDKIYNEKQAFFPNIHFPHLYFPWYSTCVSKGWRRGILFFIYTFFSGKVKKTSDFFTVGDVVKKTITSSLSQPCCHILYLQVTGNHKHWRKQGEDYKGKVLYVRKRMEGKLRPR